MYAKKRNGKKLIALLLVLVLLLGCGIGGTLAWLSATSGIVTNTFTVGDVNIDLKEHELGADGKLTTEETTAVDTYKIVPGDTQPKDPFVTVEANSEDSWIFVQVKEVNNAVTGNDEASKYVTWAIAEGWTKLGETSNGVSTYYRSTNYTTSAEGVTYYVLKGDSTNGANGYVSYDSNLTKANLEAVNDTNKPQLIFKAFAVQAEAGADPTTAWDVIATDQKLG